MVDAKKMPGKNLFFAFFLEDCSSSGLSSELSFVGGRKATSRVFGTEEKRSFVSSY
jgi:hypothetical protein